MHAEIRIGASPIMLADEFDVMENAHAGYGAFFDLKERS
jgi:uncharacterized glyoxalase superfamily protein PhnB